MNEEEKALLLLLGFDFTMKERAMTADQIKAWNARYWELVAYKKEFGNCRVPQRCKDNPQLGQWVALQRKRYKSLTLTEDCRVKLEELGFEWEVYKVRNEDHQFKDDDQTQLTAGSKKAPPPKPQHIPTAVAIGNRGVDADEAEWQSFYEQLKEYKRGHNTFAVDETKNQDLATWVKHIRTTKTLGTITKKHYEQLVDIQFFPKVPPERLSFPGSKSKK